MLLVGNGYAGSRFLHAFNYLEELGSGATVVGVCDSRLDALPDGIPTYTSVHAAVSALRPDIVCVAVNEQNHIDVFRQLQAFPRLSVFSEKPLVSDPDDISAVYASLKHHAFSMNMVERFSPAIDFARHWLAELGASRLLRAESFWGKHRIGDPRPTMGVLSELIHPLDLIQYLFDLEQFDVCGAIGVCSDFSPHGERILDSIDVHAQSEGASIILHSSFVWPKRRRSVSALISSETTGDLFRIEFSFDTPHWDNDSVEIQVVTSAGRYETILFKSWEAGDYVSPPGIGKVTEFVRRSLTSWRRGERNSSLVDLRVAVGLQQDLNAISDSVFDRTHTGRIFV